MCAQAQHIAHGSVHHRPEVKQYIKSNLVMESPINTTL
jgi:hypothetical protein